MTLKNKSQVCENLYMNLSYYDITIFEVSKQDLYLVAEILKKMWISVHFSKFEKGSNS